MPLVGRIAAGLGALVVGSLVMVALALLYFVVTAWIVTFGVRQVTGVAPSPDWVALAASILTVGGLLGSAYRAVAATAVQRPPERYEGQEFM